MNLIRVKRAGRDPRFLLGILLIAGGGILGASLASGEESVLVARVEQNVASGDMVDGRLIGVEVPAAMAGSLISLASVDSSAIAARSLEAGEFVQTGDLTSSTPSDQFDLRVPLALTPAGSLDAGDLTEVWRVASSNTGESASAEKIADAVVLRIDSSESMVSSVSAQLRLGADDVERVLTALGTGDSFVLVVPTSGAQ